MTDSDATSPLKDFLGRPFEVGQKVVYPLRKKSQMWSNLAQITEVGINYLRVQRLVPECQHVIELRSLSTVVVLEAAPHVTN